MTDGHPVFIQGQRIESRGALAGPESAAEHVRNALQLLGVAGGAVIPPRVKQTFLLSDVEAIRARLRAALAAIEAGGR